MASPWCFTRCNGPGSKRIAIESCCSTSRVQSIRELTAGLDQTAHGARWMPDSQSLVFMSEYRGCDQLFRIWVNSHGVQQISRGVFNWAVHDVLPDGKTLLVASQNMLRPGNCRCWTSKRAP